MPITIRDISVAGSRFFLKSEWGPVSDYWPALSFSKPSVGVYLRQVYKPSKDFIVYAGTSNAERTRNAEHRKRLLSVLTVDPHQLFPTESLIPQSSWSAAKDEHGKVWPHSFTLFRAWECTSFPEAQHVTPLAYRHLGIRSNWGGVVEVIGEEVEALLCVRVVALNLALRKPAIDRANQRSWIDDPVLNPALVRLEQLIKARVGRFGQQVTRQLPSRTLPREVNLLDVLAKKYKDQLGLCALCGQTIPLDTNKKLLQLSPDRIDSSNNSYGSDNLQITHLACNLAKNDGTVEDFEEWLQTASGGATSA